ncbi:hypothetical protein [Gordonia sp. N1V]|uniref:DUF7620 family protein n=1 Tax=Gordonia sp. N1V TaxID=3034163 RepID=UPI0023E0DA30|nr:hypothetical protein [Gordonia sp. N1V]MDF3280495.1 hypothetical protein [Gordonia sp. N1V]
MCHLFRRPRPLGPDPVVVDAEIRRSRFEAQTEQVRRSRREVDARRAEAADLLAQSREAERRNHFAEAITKSMRRKP